MGLEGVSINQLRVVPERGSNELNSNVNFSLNTEIRSVDGLSSGQKVDPDKEKEHEKQKQKKKENKEDSEFSLEESADEHALLTSSEEPVVKYDLSKSEKYSLELDSETEDILIVEKHSRNVVQRINADELSRFVNFLPSPKGALINRKF